VTRASVFLALCAWPAAAEHYLRIDADGQRYTLDTDKTAVRRAMHPVSLEKAAARLPAWLFPSPGAVPSQAHYDVADGIAAATFPCAGSEAEVAVYYTQVLRNHRYAVSSLPAGRGGEQITGSTSYAVITVTVIPDERNGGANARATYAPRQAPANLNFQALWYDDSTGVLRLREVNTGDEYEMEKRAILECNLNRPGGVASTGAGMPGWLPVYPGAISSPKGRVSWLIDPTAEFLTRDPVRQVYNFYLEAVRSAGAHITESGMAGSSRTKGGPMQDWSGRITAFLGDDKIEIMVGEVMWTFQGLGAKTPDEHTGIAIRYSLPKR